MHQLFSLIRQESAPNFVTVLTELGHSAVLILNLTFDNEPFRITLIDDYDYDVLGQTQIISMTKDIVVKFELIDTNCGNNMTVFLANVSLRTIRMGSLYMSIGINRVSKLKYMIVWGGAQLVRF